MRLHLAPIQLVESDQGFPPSVADLTRLARVVCDYSSLYSIQHDYKLPSRIPLHRAVTTLHLAENRHIIFNSITNRHHPRPFSHPVMFASNALPLPTPFGHEHRPLRLTSESARPQPQGPCHYSNPPGQDIRCSCQLYQHDRRAPGNICDCGHSACYHSPTQHAGRLSPDRVITALVEKVKKLEECIVKERESRKDELSRERQLWEREARVLREALSPFYHTEQDMRRKLLDLEDKVDANYDEHNRLGERVLAIDDANATLERRIQMWEDARGRKRKASVGVEGHGVMSPESNYTSASSIESDTTLSSTNMSPQPPSPANPPMPVRIAVPSPRSSGVLNHRAVPRHSGGHSFHDQRQLPMPGMVSEPRSSGFLSIDLAQRLRRKDASPPEAKARSLSGRRGPSAEQKARSPSTSSELPTPPQGRVSSGALPVSGLLSNSPTRADLDTRSPKKRKQQNGMMALDVLANASMASPLAH